MDDDSLFWDRYEQIQAMPQGEKRDQALNDLFQDYEGSLDTLDRRYDMGTSDAETRMPRGRMAGQVYVAANPLEHLSAALRQGYGGYQQQQALRGMEDLSAARTRANTALHSAGLRAPRQGAGAAASMAAGPGMPNVGQTAPTMTPQELDELLRRMGMR